MGSTVARTTVEFYCNDCPGGGYFVVNVNMAWEGTYVVVCPKCGREHPRKFAKGQMADNMDVRFENGKGNILIERPMEMRKDLPRIISPMSSWSKEKRLELVLAIPAGFMDDVWQRKQAHERGIDLLGESAENEAGA
jgi:hypothetical protein